MPSAWPRRAWTGRQGTPATRLSEAPQATAKTMVQDKAPGLLPEPWAGTPEQEQVCVHHPPCHRHALQAAYFATHKMHSRQARATDIRGHFYS